MAKFNTNSPVDFLIVIAIRKLAKLLAKFAVAVVVLTPVAANGGINDQFPVHDPSSLSPPSILAPIHVCGAAVFVYGYLPGATVRVFANTSELVGQDTPVLGFQQIKLTRPLVIGDAITATQTISGITSGHSYDPVIVGPYPTLTTPLAGPDVYACGQIVPVGNLIASTHVEVRDVETNSVIGSGEATHNWEPIVTASLTSGHHVRAVQIACPHGPGTTVTSPPSAPIPVQPEPMPLPFPLLDPVIPGNDIVNMHHLLVGAAVAVKDGATPIGGGLATAPNNWTHVAPPISMAPVVTAAQKLCSPSAPSPPAQVTTSLPPPILGGPICEGSHFVTIDNTVLNANVVLLRSGSIIGYGGAVPGSLKLAIGTGVTLHSGDVLTAIQYIGSIISPPSNPVTVGCDSSPDVVTQHNNNSRTGTQTGETTLTPGRVLLRGMRIKYTHSVEGAISAQPLYVRRVPFATGAANGLFVATLSNKLYAIDADTGTEKWSRTLADSDPSTRGLARGIGGTPVIDVGQHRIYVLFSTKNQPVDGANTPAEEADLAGLDVAYWLVILDIRDGSELARVQVSATLYRADGTPVNFVAKNQGNRPALLLDHGSTYIAFGMRFREEIIEYHGWVLRYRASDLAFQGAFCTSPNSTVPTSPFTSHVAQGAGIWQGGGGLAADADGNTYFLTGNARADIASDSFGDAFLKLTPSGSALIPTAYVPGEAGPNPIQLSDPDDCHNPSSGDDDEKDDADVGAGGAMTIPGFNLVIGGGKTGYMFLMDSGAMYLHQQITAATNQYHPGWRNNGWDCGPHLHGSPTYWRGPDPTFANLYVWGEKDRLRLYRLNTVTHAITEPATHQGAVLALPDTMPGGMLSISTQGNTAGAGIVWATLPASDTVAPGTLANPGHLYAFNAETLTPLWDTGFSSMGKWLPPTIADGKVFIGTSSNEVIAYELGTCPLIICWIKQLWPFSLLRRPFHPRQLNLRAMAVRRPIEESIGIMPGLILASLLPSQGKRDLVLQGGGELVYEAKLDPSNKQKLVWVEQGSFAKIAPAPRNKAGNRGAAEHVRFELTGQTLRASDGSSALMEVQKVVPAPEADAPWLLIKLTSQQNRGVLAGEQYLQRIATMGGMPPEDLPSKEGETRRVSYHAQYILYR